MIGTLAIILMQRFALSPRTAGWIARGILASLALLALYAAYSWAQHARDGDTVTIQKDAP